MRGAPQRAAGGESSGSASQAPSSHHEASEEKAPRRKDAQFPRSVRATFKAISSATTETTLDRVPWGPRLSVLFLPRGAQSIAGGRLRVYAVAEAFEAKVADVAIPSATDPVQILVEAGCDAFLIRATLGSPLPSGAPQLESYVYACTYAGAL